MARSTLEILSEFEVQSAKQLPITLEAFYQGLGELERSNALFTDLARAELYLKKWPIGRLSEIIAFADSLGGLGETYKPFLEGVYSDQVECGHSPDLADFSGLDLSDVCLRAPNDPLALGEHCGSYQVVRRIAAGAFGVVFEGQAESGNSVAIKSPFRSPSASRRQLGAKLLKAEADAAMQLGGARFPKFIDWIESEGGSPCLITELVQGISLKELIASSPLESKTAVNIVADVALALYAAHSKRLLHRDVKPANVIVRDDGGAVLLDFGFAVDDESMLNLEGQVAGTRGHQSPDAILGNTPDMDARSDVWALGPLLHECLTGKPQFVTDNKEDALVQSILAATPKRQTKVIPEELQKIIDHCVEANPLARYDTALEVAQDLQKFNNPTLTFPTIERIPLLAFRIGRELGEAQCHVDAFSDYMQMEPGNQHSRIFAVGALFALNEKIRHCRILIDKPPFAEFEWPKFDLSVISILFYQRTTGRANGDEPLNAAAQKAMRWLEAACELFQEALAREPKSTLALFELGLVAATTKSVDRRFRFVQLEKLAKLAELPEFIWQSFSQSLSTSSPSEQPADELRRFYKRVEHYFLYPDSDSRSSPNP
ncbi:MAG TPA: serine/threonine-protein kinase [Pirellulaceae bacterium]|nr:serine/threonine-protein kinase [Pirellulaceae bacterium]HMO93580.1 serine/threonine-protein kinase [Pirellulaceae bacterium]HMP71432.1 serine/threonine-protein kinase [Pirellulaceae bacterium]